MMQESQRSGCPINLTLEILGDKWSLLIIRDMIFGNKRHFREFLLKSHEGIASNILADRLKRLLQEGIISKADNPAHKQKSVFSLTEKGIELLPVLAQMSAWGLKYLAVSEELGVRARHLEQGGPAMWNEFMAELRDDHLHPPGHETSPARSGSVRARLQAAYEDVVAHRANEFKVSK